MSENIYNDSMRNLQREFLNIYKMKRSKHPMQNY